MRNLFFIVILLVALGVGVFAALVIAGGGATEENTAACREGDIFDGVQAPERFKLLDRCVTARGTVGLVQDHADGDWHIAMIPDPGDLGLLGRDNITKIGGALVVEVIPKDQGRVKRPVAGSRVEVTGAYVIDMPYGWREIHPAWDVREITASPVPPGTGQEIRSVLGKAKRALVRIRAELADRFR